MLRQLSRRLALTPKQAGGVFVHRDTELSNTDIPFEWTQENLMMIQTIKNQYPLG